MKFFALALLFSITASASGGPDLTFRSLALSNRPNAINQKLPQACISVLRTHKLKSAAVRPYAVEVRDIPYVDAADGIFYHYTDAKPAIAAASKNQLSTIFNYLHRPESGDPLFYVASDDESSHAYGDSQIRVRVSPRTKVFFPLPLDRRAKFISVRNRTYKGFDFATSGATKRIAMATSQKLRSMILEDNPELEACAALRIGKMGGGWFLLMLALEQENIPLIAYFGTLAPWYQIINRSAISEMSVGVAPPITKDVIGMRAFMKKHPLK